MEPVPELEAPRREIIHVFDEVVVKYKLDDWDKLLILGDLLHHYLKKIRETNPS